MTFRVEAHCISLGGRINLIIILLLVLDIFVLLYIKSLVDLLWFKFSFGAKFLKKLVQFSFSFVEYSIYHNLEQWQIKLKLNFKPRINLNYNRYMVSRDDINSAQFDHSGYH